MKKQQANGYKILHTTLNPQMSNICFAALRDSGLSAIVPYAFTTCLRRINKNMFSKL
jgi:hypothetical protein